MKTLTVLVILAFAPAAWPQGTVNLYNGGFPFSPEAPANGVIDAPFYDAQRVLLAGPGYVAQLYGGTTASSLSPAGLPTPFVTNGYFQPEVVAVPVSFGAPAWMQVRAWAVAGGSTYEQALVAGAWTGLSNELFVQTGGGGGGVPIPPGDLIGLTFIGVPEPSAAALVLLGGALFIVFKRRRLRA